MLVCLFDSFLCLLDCFSWCHLMSISSNMAMDHLTAAVMSCVLELSKGILDQVSMLGVCSYHTMRFAVCSVINNVQGTCRDSGSVYAMKNLCLPFNMYRFPCGSLFFSCNGTEE